MEFLRKLARYSSGPAVLVGLTLATSALFKVFAFAREAFIAAKFGLSAVTDAYFGLQQFPLGVVSFMFGAFSLAFAPAYANERQRSGEVEWLPGLLFYGCLAGATMTALMIVCAPLLLHMIHSTGTREVRATLGLLSACYLPIIWIGIWKGICAARGRNLLATSLTGLPYLIMTVALLGVYAIGRLNNLSLPTSMTVGFGLVGLYSLVQSLGSQRLLRRGVPVISVWRVPAFRHFLRQLSASAMENAGFIGNQLLLLSLLARLGTGVISANNCAMRIGMLGYSLLSQPLSHLVQARLCAAEPADRPSVFRRWLLIHGTLQAVFAIAFYLFRMPTVRIAYMHGKFTGTELAEVVHLLPAWIAYCVVMSVSGLSANYLFMRSNGFLYMRWRLGAYVAANILRVAVVGRAGAVMLIWCSVATEALVMALNLRTCLREGKVKPVTPVALAAPATV